MVSLEPELVGSTAGVIETQQRRCAELGVRVETVPADFNTWETDERFDVIVSGRASITFTPPSIMPPTIPRRSRRTSPWRNG